eukprot:TRINITY_DN11242_c1_g1_i1.p1 TRINITY_DN11242_c1_g1~~TRINITY_DN11242_c1_g1_i1.p1  ORF type:complete len:339 (+),score=95.66 TRINITY_DN11242_c1_g1_i1:56-1072(+)
MPDLLLFLVIEPDNSKIPVELPPDATLRDVKDAAAAVGAPDARDQQLVFGGQELHESDWTEVCETLITHEALVVVRKKGSPHECRFSGCRTHWLRLDGSHVVASDPSSVPDFDGRVTSVHAGADRNVAVVDGKLVWWGGPPPARGWQSKLEGREVVCCSTGGFITAVVDSEGYVLVVTGYLSVPANVQGRAVAISVGGPSVVLTKEGSVFPIPGRERFFGDLVAVAVSAGESHYAALLSDHTIRVYSGGVEISLEHRPERVMRCLCGSTVTVCLLHDGTVCWPTGFFDREGGYAKVEAELGGRRVVDISMHKDVFSALMGDGTVVRMELGSMSASPIG